MKKILITGATGNIGSETIRGLKELGRENNLIAAHYDIDKSKKALQAYPELEHRKLDFEKPDTFDPALAGVDIVFLVRPPGLADVEKYFKPFLESIKRNGINRIAFLSVQGAESQPKIPHYKIEQLVLNQGLEYIFLRPSYFMQNLTTTLVREIREENRIFIPAGNLPFTWVDARDIGVTAAILLEEFEKFSNSSVEITGSEQKNFNEVAGLLTAMTGREIRYVSPNLIRFFLKKRNQGVPAAMIFVMIMLHYLPRFSKKPTRLTNEVKNITGRTPGTLEAFIERELKKFEPKS